jgi:hypothetical protein
MVWTDSIQRSVGWEISLLGLKCEENPRATHVRRRKGCRGGYVKGVEWRVEKLVSKK